MQYQKQWDMQDYYDPCITLDPADKSHKVRFNIESLSDFWSPWEVPFSLQIHFQLQLQDRLTIYFYMSPTDCLNSKTGTFNQTSFVSHPKIVLLWKK